MVSNCETLHRLICLFNSTSGYQSGTHDLVNCLAGWFTSTLTHQHADLSCSPTAIFVQQSGSIRNKQRSQGEEHSRQNTETANADERPFDNAFSDARSLWVRSNDRHHQELSIETCEWCDGFVFVRSSDGETVPYVQ